MRRRLNSDQSVTAARSPHSHRLGAARSRLCGIGQPILTHMENPFELYWLAFVLTGDRNGSADAVAEALDLDDAANPFLRIG